MLAAASAARALAGWVLKTPRWDGRSLKSPRHGVVPAGFTGRSFPELTRQNAVALNFLCPPVLQQRDLRRKAELRQHRRGSGQKNVGGPGIDEAKARRVDHREARAAVGARELRSRPPARPAEARADPELGRSAAKAATRSATRVRRFVKRRRDYERIAVRWIGEDHASFYGTSIGTPSYSAGASAK